MNEKKSKSSFIITILFIGILLPLAISNDIENVKGLVPQTPANTGKRMIIYSELTGGDTLMSSISLNGWEGKAAIDETTVAPYEGTNSINVTMVDNAWNWWGVGLELSILENLADYEGGYLTFMMNTSYNGNLTVGFQTAGGQNAAITLIPGMYGYKNDSMWHQVSLPINVLAATNPAVDLTQVLNPLMMMSSGDAQWESIFIDDVYWQAYPPRTIVYSETTYGEDLKGTITLNGWEGKANIEETSVAPYEGSSALNITMVDNAWNWWGIGLELSIMENMADFEGGYLSFMINTSYSSNLSVGFQTVGGQNAIVNLMPGIYGFDNDSEWHRVILPIDTLLATNPAADLTQVLNPFMLMSSGDAQWESIFIDDIYWQRIAPQTIIYSEDAVGEMLEGTITFNGWEGKANIEETTVAPFEGTSALNITMVDNAWNWWGVGLELSELENMEDYQSGYLSFMINTSYNGNLSVGFQSEGGQNAILTLVPGMYGFNNDSKWHRIILSIEDLLATNPTADITKIINPFMMMSSGDAQWESIFIDDINWLQIAPNLVVYSENRIGTELQSSITLNGWEGKANIEETTVAPFEGSSALNITMVDNAWNWWGVGLELSERENMAYYEGGYLSFMINTSYSGNLSVGFQSEGGQNAIMTLVPGINGYDNDSMWHRIVLSLDDLLVTNPAADLSKVLNPFMMMSSGDAYWESIFIDDIYWIATVGEQENWAPVASNAFIKIDEITGDLELEYDFFDLNDDEDMSLIQWTLNGTEMPSFENLTVVPNASLSYWDVWMANVTPYDGIEFGETISSNGILIVPPITPDPNKILIFSELTPGIPLDTGIEWVDWAATASLEFLTGDEAAEGVSYACATYLGEAGWWGISAATDPRGSGDLSAFATGTLNFMMKTTYSGPLKVGFNNQGAVDAFITLTAAHGYSNDGEWHRVTIPVADIVAENPDVDLSTLENIFALLFGGELDTDPIYFDDIYYEIGGTPIILDADIFFDPTSGNLTLDYEYSDPQSDPDMSMIQWFKNDVEVESFENMTYIPTSEFVTGDVWYAVVTPFDGENMGTSVKSNEATVPSGYEPADDDTDDDSDDDTDDDGFRISGYPVLIFIGLLSISLTILSRKAKKNI